MSHHVVPLIPVLLIPGGEGGRGVTGEQQQQDERDEEQGEDGVGAEEPRASGDWEVIRRSRVDQRSPGVGGSAPWCHTTLSYNT